MCRGEIQQMLDRGLISPSKSSYSFPVVIVPKKNGTLRMCVDYRELNKRMRQDAFPLPTCDAVFDKLDGVKFLSSLDLQAGYWQIRIDPKDRYKTAFATPFGLYEFNIMPFGLCSALELHTRLTGP